MSRFNNKKKNDTSVRVFKYYARLMSEWGEGHRAENNRRVDYWNAMCGARFAHLAAIDSIYTAASPEYKQNAERLTVLSTEIGRRRADLKTRKLSEADDGTIRLDAERRKLWARQNEIKKKLRSVTKAHLASANEIYKANRIKLRQESKLYWGNYNAVEASFEESESKSRPPRSRQYSADASFTFQCQKDPLSRKACNDQANAKGLRGEAKKKLLSACIQNGWSVASLLSGKSGEANMTPFSSTGESRRKRKQRSVLHIRVGGRERNPIFLDLSVQFDRLLPTDCPIKSITVTRRRVADRFEYHVCFTVETPLKEPKMGSRVGDVHLFQRRINKNELNGLTVGAVTDVASGEVMPLGFIPPPVFGLLHRSAELRSLREQNILRTLAHVRPLINSAKAPEAIRAFAEPLARKRGLSAAPLLVSLERAWRETNWRPDVHIELNEWRKLDRCQWQEAIGAEQHARKYVKNQHRQWAMRRLCQNFDELRLPDTSFIMRKDTNAPTRPVEQLWNSYKSVAALGQLREIIKQTAAREGVRVVSYTPETREPLAE